MLCFLWNSMNRCVGVVCFSTLNLYCNICLTSYNTACFHYYKRIPFHFTVMMVLPS